MVLGHTGLPSSINDWIFSFHMPLFIIVSGMLFYPARYATPLKFIRKRALTLLFPYLIFSMVVLPFSNERITDWLLSGWNNGIALWFLPVLFLSEIYSYFTIKSIRSCKGIFISALIYGTIGYILYLLHIRLPYDIDASISATMFYLLGYCIKEPLFSFSTESFSMKALLVISSLFALNIALSQMLPKTDMAWNHCGLYGLNAFNAVAGSVAVFFISMIISRWTGIVQMILSWAGKNTLTILGLSQVISIELKDNLNILPQVPGGNNIARQIILWSLLYIISWAINRFAPWILGNTQKY